MHRQHRALAPRQASHLPPPSAPPGHGMPHERHARIAARRGFVELKQHFIDAVAPLGGPRGDWLRRQVRQSHEPMDLWLLRSAVLDALDQRRRQAQHDPRAELQRALDSMFPAADELNSSLSPLFL